MTRFVVDAGVVLRLAREELSAAAAHELLAPTLLRSQVLSLLHEDVHGGRLARDEGLELLERASAIRIRLLGDLVLRRNAWRYADELDSASTYESEYVALTRLQADALVTLDRELARRVDGIVPTAPFEALLRP
ncbi:MAG TPA: type II toxin-antitoxin system VapC family toxin [Gaiellaceae bacterium]|nr:type II toxin-antitoxin system VapC family toxin [Gaiellaceae bacterium]